MDLLDKEVLGQTVRRIRLEIGYHQETVAQAIGCNRSTYSYKEQGKTWFHINDILQISELFQVPLEQFFHPEPYSCANSFTRVGRGTVRETKNLGQLRPAERKLIGLLRVCQNVEPDSSYLERFQNTLQTSIEQHRKSEKSK